MSQEQFGYRIKEAQVNPILGEIPFKLPSWFKMYFRKSEWKLTHAEGVTFSKEEAEKILKDLREGILSGAGNTNLRVMVIEEVPVAKQSS